MDRWCAWRNFHTGCSHARRLPWDADQGTPRVRMKIPMLDAKVESRALLDFDPLSYSFRYDEFLPDHIPPIL